MQAIDRDYRKPMSRIGPVTALAVGLGMMASVATARAPASIPAAFRGHWYEDGTTSCASDPDGLLDVSASEFTYPMSSNTRVSTQSIGPGRIRVSYVFQSGGEGAGGPRRGTETWTLLNGGRHLKITPVGAARPLNGVTDLYRCAGAGTH